ncbi:unnamed protein product, partial [Brenthis ino]
MLAIIALIFDPLGLLSPCVIRMKMLLQHLWLKGLNWDDQLTAKVGTEWANLIKNLPAINNIHIPRRVTCDAYQHFEIHVFVDASEKAYGACLYIRSVNRQGDVSVHLAMAKSRVTPIKPTARSLFTARAALSFRLEQTTLFMVSHSKRRCNRITGYNVSDWMNPLCFNIEIARKSEIKPNWTNVWTLDHLWALSLHTLTKSNLRVIATLRRFDIRLIA